MQHTACLDSVTECIAHGLAKKYIIHI